MSGIESSGDDSIAALIAQGLRENQEYKPIPIEPFRPTDQAQYDGALPPKDALARFPFGQDVAITQLFRELQVTRVLGIAEQGIWSDGDGAWTLIYMEIPVWVWNRELPPAADFWETGYLERLLPHTGLAINAGLNRFLKLFGVRFSFDRVPHLGVRQQSPNPPPKTVGEVVVPHAGGRPPKPFWEGLWVEMCRQLYEGDLKPVRQADVERAMADWLASQGHSASEGAIRDRARRLFAVVKPEDKN